MFKILEFNLSSQKHRFLPLSLVKLTGVIFKIQTYWTDIRHRTPSIIPPTLFSLVFVIVMASITMDIDPNVSLHLESSSSDGAVSFQPVKTNLEDFSRCFTVDLRDFSGTVTFHVRDIEAAGRKRKRVSDSNSNCSSNTETNTETNSNSNGTGKVVLNSVTPFHSSKKNQKQQPKSFSALTPQFGQTSPSSTQTQTTVLLHTDDVIQRQSQRSQRHLNLNLGFTDKNNDGSASDNDGNASENTYESSSNIINAEATAALKDSSPIRTTNATQLTLPPAKRWAHTATLIPAHGNSLLVYGGQNENGRILSDIFLYDVDLSSWSRPQNCDGLPRCWHSCTYVPQREVLVVFGGVSVGIDNKEEITDMTMLFDTDMMLWYPAETNGVRPVGRSGHSAALLGKQVLIFGGIKKSGRMQNSIAMLDVETWGWR